MSKRDTWQQLSELQTTRNSLTWSPGAIQIAREFRMLHEVIGRDFLFKFLPAYVVILCHRKGFDVTIYILDIIATFLIVFYDIFYGDHFWLQRELIKANEVNLRFF